MKLKVLIIIVIVAGLFFIWIIRENDGKVVSDNIYLDKPISQEVDTAEIINELTVVDPTISEPISNAISRITKKPFGIKISPDKSPVQPERFSGFHTGTDFEITPEELDKEIKVYAICDGKVIQKGKVGGYGEVIIQECLLENQSVTVIYGHLSLNKISKNYLSVGDEVAILGKDKSEDTDGERKHLHLGIHKGDKADLRGYVSAKEELIQWINIEDYLND